LNIEYTNQSLRRNKFGLSFVHVTSRFVFDINQSFVICVKGNSRHSRTHGRGIHLMNSLWFLESLERSGTNRRFPRIGGPSWVLTSWRGSALQR